MSAISSTFLLSFWLILILIAAFTTSVASIGSIIDSSALSRLGQRKQTRFPYVYYPT